MERRSAIKNLATALDLSAALIKRGDGMTVRRERSHAQRELSGLYNASLARPGKCHLGFRKFKSRANGSSSESE